MLTERASAFDSAAPVEDGELTHRQRINEFLGIEADFDDEEGGDADVIDIREWAPRELAEKLGL